MSKGLKPQKNLFLMAVSLRPNPPSPLELNGCWSVGTFVKKRFQKKLIFSMSFHAGSIGKTRYIISHNNNYDHNIM